MNKTHNNPRIGGGGFHHTAIRAHNFDTTVAFYTDVLGFRPGIAWEASGGRAVMLDTGDGNYLEIFERPPAPHPNTHPNTHPASNPTPSPTHPPAKPDKSADEEPPILHIALRTDDTDAATERVRAAGMTITMEPKTVDIANTNPDLPTPVPVRISFFRGPEGELVEFFQNEIT